MVEQTFAAWDRDYSGNITIEQFRRVIKALDPNLSERDIRSIVRCVDTDENKLIDSYEFVDWATEDDPLFLHDSFEDFMAKLMCDAGRAARHHRRNIAEVLVRPDGLMFVTAGGDESLECTRLHHPEVQLMLLEPEEFINILELTDQGVLVLTLNSGRVGRLPTAHSSSCPPFGPFLAPEGFQIIGVRTKDGGVNPANGRVVGVEIGPQPFAKRFDAPSALRYAARHAFMRMMQDILAKAEVDVNCPDSMGITPLMRAAEEGSIAAIRALLVSKANTEATDVEGWTALRFATENNQSSAVDMLLSKKATMDGDCGSAYQAAMKNRYNCVARSHLRARKRNPGVFALEPPPWQEAYQLDIPMITPFGGTFAGSVTVEIVHGGTPMAVAQTPVAKTPKKSRSSLALPPVSPARGALPSISPNRRGSLPTISPQRGANGAGRMISASPHANAGADILYTLDGRDPYTAGIRYEGPFTLTDEEVRVRVVAVRGAKRSCIVEATFVICSHILPDEVVGGSLSITTFPEAEEVLQPALANLLGAPSNRVFTKAIASPPEGQGSWVRLPVVNPKPNFRLLFEQKFGSMKKNEKMRKQFLAKVCKDLRHKKACGVDPEGSDITEHKKRVALTFCMPSQEADVLKAQLTSSESYLSTEARCRSLFASARLEPVDQLGQRLCDAAMWEALRAALGKKSKVEDIEGVGRGDSGVLAFKVPTKKEAARLRETVGKAVTGAVKQFAPEAVLEPFRECAPTVELSYEVDVVASGQPVRGKASRHGGSGGGEKLVSRSGARRAAAQSAAARQANNAGVSILERAAGARFAEEYEAALQSVLPTASVEVGRPAAARVLWKVRLQPSWKRAEPTGPCEVAPIQDFLDTICLAYAGSRLAQVVDLRAGTTFDGPTTHESRRLAAAVSRALRVEAAATTAAPPAAAAGAPPPPQKGKEKKEKKEKKSGKKVAAEAAAAAPGGANATEGAGGGSGPVSEDTPGAQCAELDLSALPPEITDVYFVLAAFDADPLSAFPHPAVSIVDPVSGRTLTSCCGPDEVAPGAQAVLLCSLATPSPGRWVVRQHCYCPPTSVRQRRPGSRLDAVRAFAAERQNERYGRWERRGELVKLRVLHDRGWLQEASSSRSARFFWEVLGLHVPLFQAICAWL